MNELPIFTPDFEEYTRLKEAGTDGFHYERNYGHNYSVAILKVSLMTIRRDIEKMSHVIRHFGPDKGGH